jgi:hypothetical protein
MTIVASTGLAIETRVNHMACEGIVPAPGSGPWARLSPDTNGPYGPFVPGEGQGLALARRAAHVEDLGKRRTAHGPWVPRPFG